MSASFASLDWCDYIAFFAGLGIGFFIGGLIQTLQKRAKQRRLERERDEAIAALSRIAECIHIMRTQAHELIENMYGRGKPKEEIHSGVDEIVTTALPCILKEL